MFIATQPSPDAPASSDYAPPSLRHTVSVAAATLHSEALLRGRREVEIVHAGQVYRLRHTRNGKLILTK